MYLVWTLIRIECDIRGGLFDSFLIYIDTDTLTTHIAPLQGIEPVGYFLCLVNADFTLELLPDRH